MPPKLVRGFATLDSESNLSNIILAWLNKPDVEHIKVQLTTQSLPFFTLEKPIILGASGAMPCASERGRGVLLLLLLLFSILGS